MQLKAKINKDTPTLKQLLKDPYLFLAFGFGSGLSPIIPGTIGTIVGVALYVLLAQLSLLYFCLLIGLAFIFGCYVCGYATKKMGVHDHPGIVWDEFVGLWITFVAVDFSWANILAGFILFRLFDMLKPWPISIADRHIHGGLGIMFDDVLAAIGAWVCLQLLIYYKLLNWLPF